MKQLERSGRNPVFAHLLAGLLVFVATMGAANAAAFTPGNLAVLQAGDGAQALANTGNTIYIFEYTTNGVFVSSNAVPDSGASAFLITGTATGEGALMRSPDGRLLCFAGYNTNRSASSALNSTTSLQVPRAVGTMDAYGNFVLAARTTNQFSGGSIRAGATDGTNSFWGTGANGLNSDTYYFGNLGAPGAVQTTLGNTRVLNIFNGGLYVSAPVAATRGVYGFTPNGLPTNASTPNLLINAGASSSVFGFSISPAGNFAYTADDNAPTSGGGLIRWTNNAGVWSQAYVVSTNAARGLVVDYSGASPVLYATTITNSLIRVTDTGAASPATLLVAGAANIALRGVAFTPVLIGPVLTLFGAATVTNECHTAFTDPGATNSAGFAVSVSGSVDTNTPGTYVLTYTGTNSVGLAASTNRTVVVGDTLPPVITLLGANPFTNLLNVPFVDPGATALDACGGSMAVSSNNNVNIAVPGFYTSTYTAVDSYGNAATNTRTVVVRFPVTFLVTTNSNSGIGSLRQAISNSFSGDTITFATNLSGTTITLTSGQLVVSNSLTIDASALANGITISGNNASRIFQVNSNSTVLLESLTLTGGNGAGASNNGRGGAVFVATGAALSANNCTFTGNSATLTGGAVLNFGTFTATGCTFSTNTAPTNGGAVANDSAGVATFTNCTLAANTQTGATQGGGAINHTFSAIRMTLSHCTLVGNSSSGSEGGGGLRNRGPLFTLHNCIVAGNTNFAGTGADVNNSVTLTRAGANLIPALANTGTLAGPAHLTNAPLLAPLGNYGGSAPTMPPLPGSPAIDAAGSTTLTNDQRGFLRPLGVGPDIGAVEANFFSVVTTTADSGTGSLRQAILNTDPGGTITFTNTLSGSNIVLTSGQLLLNKGLTIDASALTNGITVNGNNASRIFEVQSGQTVVLTALTLTNGNASFGAGIYNAGNLTVNQSTLTRNSATGAGGAIYSEGSLTVSKCAFLLNLAYEGGGIRSVDSDLSVNNSSFATNTATVGGACSIAGSGSAMFQHLTIVGNVAAGNGGCCAGGGLFSYLRPATLVNSIVFGNSAPIGPDIQFSNTYFASAVLTSSGVNLVGNLSFSGLSVVPGVIVGNPLLAPLGNYGGPTMSMPPLSGSPAIDGCTNGTTFTNDQRGVLRPIGPFADIGAVEFQPTPPIITLLGANPYTNECHFLFTDPGATNSAGFPVTVSGAVNPNSPGSYVLTYIGTNSYSQSTTNTRTLVVRDTLPPVITLLGANPFTNALNVPLVDPGATALDDCGGGFSVSSSNNVNLALAGNYTITYTSVDSYGNAATNTRTVVVRLPVTYLVTTNSDNGAGSLRQTIADALSGDTISFTNTLSGAIILLTNGELTLDKNLTIDASALPGGIQINGNRASRIFSVAGGTTNVLTALTLTNGFITGTGGGIYNAGTLTVNRCTLVTNVATSFGGGIANDGTLTVLQSTLTGNSCSNSGGGGIHVNSGTVTVNQSTVTGNRSVNAGAGGIYNSNTSALTLINTIVAGNTAPTYTNLFGSFAQSGVNLTNGNPLLAPLGNYGGPTMTMPPLTNSPAIDSGGTNTLATDQRGFPRPVGAGADIGAVEVYWPGNDPFGNALFFCGNQSVNVTNFGAIIPSNAVTVEFWAYTTAAAVQSAFVLNPDLANSRFQASLNHGGSAPGVTYWDFGDSAGLGHLGPVNAPANSISNWIHYAFVASLSGNYMSIYTNGVLYAAKAGMTPFVPGNFELRIGGGGYRGRLDEFRIWNTNRSQAQIQATMNSKLIGNESGLLLYYPFDSIGGNVVTNRATVTGSAFNGTAVNNPIPANTGTLPASGGADGALAYTFTTLAGLSTAGSTDGVGNDARFSRPIGVAVDTNGNVFVADNQNSTIRKITPAGVVTTIAGLAGNPGSADGTNGTARFKYPSGIAVDQSGNVYVGDAGNGKIRKIAPNGVVTTLANSTADGDTFFPNLYVAVDDSGAIYAGDKFSVMKLTLVGTNWIKTTLAGKLNTSGYADGPGTNALFVDPNGLAVDKAGNVYVCDQFAKGQNNSYIRMIAPDGMVTTIAGGLPPNSTTNSTGDGVGTNANIKKPFGIAVDSATNLYIGDGNNRTVRKLTRIGLDWSVTTIAGHNVASGDFFASMSGVGTNALFGIVTGVAADNSGNVYAVDTSLGNICKITSAGLATAIAGPGDSPGFQDGTGVQARFNYPSGVTLDSAGNLYVADRENHIVRKITSAGLVITLAGAPGVAGEQDGIGNQARFSEPRGIVTDRLGNIYVTDTGSNTVRKITSAGVVSTIAGSGVQGYANGAGTIAQFDAPAGIAIDTAGNLYVVDQGNACIRLITPDHVVSTIAGLPQLVHSSRRQNDIYYDSSGNPVGGYADGIGTNALFNNPSGITMDSAGNLYVADTGNFVVRKVTRLNTTNGFGVADWMVTTLAGVVGANGSIDGAGATAKFGWAFPNLRTAGMTGITVDSSGNLYVTDDSNNTIRKISPNGVVTTLAGLAGVSNSGGTDGTGDEARFNVPYAIAVDAAGSLYVADLQNQTIRKGTFAQYGPANLVSFSPPPMNSSLKVTLLPPEAYGQWRFPWEIAWHNSGDTVSNLVAGNYLVEFQNIAGMLAVPASVTLPVTGATFYTNLYYPTIQTVDTNNGGSLTVTLGPNPPPGSGWGFLGASPPWFSSGYTTNLVAGNYLITFKPVSGRVTPPNLSLQVLAGQPTYVSQSYLLAQSAPGGVLLPTPVPVANIANVTDYPFGFAGQLTSDTGNGSGVAVAANVVLTAAHVVFNDQTLSYVNQVYWYSQREVGSYEPQPLPARGWYVLSGYAAQRTNDLQFYAPDSSTPQSRNLDVAALYFLSPVAGGGYAGYLPSNASPNNWLAGAAMKMLVGYPVDGSQFGNATITPGKMYQTEPRTTPLTLATDPVDNQQVYKATWFLGYPGNSGGPFYVQFNGYYYPAGVYLGTLYNGVTPYASAVRAIDSDVVNLITQAGNLGDSGTNFTGGGVITLLAGSVNSGHPAYIQVNLGPAGAVSAGAGWRLQGDASFGAVSNYTRTITSSNAVIEFKPVNGWNLPTNQSISLTPGQLTVIAGNYTLAQSVADLAVGLVGPPNAPATNNFTYTLLITNMGSSVAGGVILTDTLPAGVTFISASGGGSNNAGIVTWPALTSLTNGGTTNFTLTVKAPASGKLTNTVSVGSSTSDTNVANNTVKLVTLVIVSPPVMVANMANGMGLSGTPGTTYRIEYRNSFTNGQWLPLKTNTVGAGVSYFVSPWPPTNRTPTFYRAVWLP